MQPAIALGIRSRSKERKFLDARLIASAQMVSIADARKRALIGQIHLQKAPHLDDKCIQHVRLNSVQQSTQGNRHGKGTSQVLLLQGHQEERKH
jgi:hypothetical protein